MVPPDLELETAMSLIDPLKADELALVCHKLDLVCEQLVDACVKIDEIPVTSLLAMQEAVVDGFHHTTVTEISSKALNAVAKLRDHCALVPGHCQSAISRIEISMACAGNDISQPVSTDPIPDGDGDIA